jgi:hypothetical protein
MNEFVTWATLATYGGALAMVLVLTQLTKGLGFIKSIPTQLWSYLLSLAVLYPAMYFTGQLSANIAVLTLFNGAMISLAANGGFEAIQRIKG